MSALSSDDPLAGVDPVRIDQLPFTDGMPNGSSIVVAAVIKALPVSTLINGRQYPTVDRQGAASRAPADGVSLAAAGTPARPMASASRRIASITN